MVNQNMNRNNGSYHMGNSNQRQMRTGSMNHNNDKNRAMCNIYELGFALTEAMLYLDTHPDDKDAIEYYTDTKEKYKNALEKYSDYYGPIDMTNMTNENYWMWVATPMPWEMEDC